MLVRQVHNRELADILCLREAHCPFSPPILKVLNLLIFKYIWRVVDLWYKLDYLVMTIC